jgi:hypothetical protein
MGLGHFRKYHNHCPMRKLMLAVVAIFFCILLFAQQKEFEGTIVYKVDVRSKTEGFSDRDWKRVLLFGDSVTVAIKQGNYKQSSELAETYSIYKDKRAYVRLKGIDTLYYLDYSFDTSTVTGVEKPEGKKTIAGLECKPIIIRTGKSVKTYYYAPALYMNPEYDKDNRIGRYDVFANETSSLPLSLNDENDAYSLIQNCTRWQEKKIDENIFTLPPLPQKQFSYEALWTPPRFRGSSWTKYLQANIKAELGAKYIKIPKGESSATQMVNVSFVIDSKGKVINTKVLNKEEVHPKLAEEALRVVSESPLWTPSNLLGEKIAYRLTQPIIFQATK